MDQDRSTSLDVFDRFEGIDGLDQTDTVERLDVADERGLFGKIWSDFKGKIEKGLGVDIDETLNDAINELTDMIDEGIDIDIGALADLLQ